MKRQIRRGTFETNSSSTHSICITKNDIYQIPEVVNFYFDEFGWEWRTYKDTQTKANYLYTGIYDCFEFGESEKYINAIKEYLNSEGIECVFCDEVKERSYENNGNTEYYKCIDGYVDHSENLDEFIIDVCSDKDKLFRYLFSNHSFIVTGNDNDYCDVDISVDYEHDSYYKGN